MSELQNLVDALGPHRAADLCRVHRTTLLRWLAGQTRVPAAALATLRAAAWGQMPGRERAWDGWTFDEGYLWSPEGVRFSRGDVASLPYVRDLVKALQADVARLEAQLVAATRAAAETDRASNDAAIWPDDVRSRAFPRTA